MMTHRSSTAYLLLAMLISAGCSEVVESRRVPESTLPKDFVVEPTHSSPRMTPWKTDAQRMSFVKSNADVVVLSVLKSVTRCDAQARQLQSAKFRVLEVLKGDLSSQILDLEATCVKGVYDVFKKNHTGRTFALFLQRHGLTLSFVSTASDAHVLLPRSNEAIAQFKQEYRSYPEYGLTKEIKLKGVSNKTNALDQK